jgi:hypothetical protein
VTDTELVYALYVQANPVPDPKLLPLTQEEAEAELLTHKRSTDMDIQERIEVRPAPKAPPRRRSLALGLAAVLVVAVAAAAIVWFVAGGDEGAVAAGDARPEVVFDGESCRYNGPTLIEQGNTSLLLVNSSAQAVTATGFNVPASELTAELALAPLGSEMALSADAPMPAGTTAFSVSADPGSEATGPLTLLPGTHLIDCLYYESATAFLPTYVWRTQTLIEVVAP